jgi:hypothetical protein
VTNSGRREEVALVVEQPIGGTAGVIVWTYAKVLKLYPREFSGNFAAEMLEVFTLALLDALKAGSGSLLSLLYRELVDLPVTLVLEYFHQRRKRKMQLIRYESSNDVQSVRLLARGLSLVFVALSLATFVNYGIGNAELTPAAIVLGGLTITMMLAWRWEKVGGNLTMIGSPLGVISAIYMLRGMSGSDFFGAFLVGVAMSAAALIVGWLFVSVAQHSTLTTTPGAESGVSRRSRILTYLGIALVVIVLLAITLFSGPYQKVDGVESGVQPIVTMEVRGTAVP